MTSPRSVLAAAAAALAVLGGPVPAFAQEPAPPALVATPASHSVVRHRGWHERVTISVAVDGPGEVAVAEVVAEGAGATVEHQDCTGRAVTPDRPCLISFIFVSLDAGRHELAVVVRPENGPELRVPIVVELLAESGMSLDPGTVLDFGDVLLGTSAERTLRFTNGSPAVQLIDMFPPKPNPFDQVNMFECMDNVRLLPGQGCTARYRFTPKVQGEVTDRALVDALGMEPVWIELRGRGVVEPPPAAPRGDVVAAQTAVSPGRRPRAAGGGGTLPRTGRSGTAERGALGAGLVLFGLALTRAGRRVRP